jgi:Family of unknown function (DUF5670)
MLAHRRVVHLCNERRWGNMLWTIAVIMLILWLLGMITAHTLGGFVHIL